MAASAMTYPTKNPVRLRRCHLLTGVLFIWWYSTCNGAQLSADARDDTSVASKSAMVNVDEAARRSAAPDAKKPVLRCWQGGHLIVERRIEALSIGAKRIDKAVPVRKSEPRLLNLHEAMCLVE